MLGDLAKPPCSLVKDAGLATIERSLLSPRIANCLACTVIVSRRAVARPECAVGSVWRSFYRAISCLRNVLHAYSGAAERCEAHPERSMAAKCRADSPAHRQPERGDCMRRSVGNGTPVGSVLSILGVSDRRP